MFTAENICDTLAAANDRQTILALRLDKITEINKPFLYPTPFSNIYKEISYILKIFRTMAPRVMGRRIKGLTVSQLSYILDKTGEPWPDAWIAIAIRYQLLAINNKNYSEVEIMKMEFNNLDVNQNDAYYSFTNFESA